MTTYHAVPSHRTYGTWAVVQDILDAKSLICDEIEEQELAERIAGGLKVMDLVDKAFTPRVMA